MYNPNRQKAGPHNLNCWTVNRGPLELKQLQGCKGMQRDDIGVEGCVFRIPVALYESPNLMARAEVAEVIPTEINNNNNASDKILHANSNSSQNGNHSSHGPEDMSTNDAVIEMIPRMVITSDDRHEHNNKTHNDSY